jgi:hypothetical protein
MEEMQVRIWHRTWNGLGCEEDVVVELNGGDGDQNRYLEDLGSHT